MSPETINTFIFAFFCFLFSLTTLLSSAFGLSLKKNNTGLKLSESLPKLYYHLFESSPDFYNIIIEFRLLYQLLIFIIVFPIS